MNSNAGLSPEDLAFIQRQRDAGQSAAPITSAYAFPGAAPGWEGSVHSPASPDSRGYGTPHFPGAAPGWNDQNPTSGAIASMLYPGAPKQMAESPPLSPSSAPQPGEINTWTPDQHAQAISDVTSGIDSAMKAAQRDALVKRWGPGTIQPMDAGSGAYNDGGRRGPISPEEMAAIESRRPAFREQANNPDPRDLSRIPLPPERVPASVQALPPDELAALQARLGRDAPTGQMALSPAQPLQAEPGYPDLIAAARAKLAGQDVTVPTVVGSGRYAGGSAEAQQLQRQSWQRARGARSARAIDQAGRMENDPMTQYRAARAGNPIAGLQATLGALGGADSVNGRAFVLGPDNAARIELGNQDAAARQAAADAEAGVGRDFLQQKRESEIAALAGQFMQADPSLTPEQARAKAASLFGVPAPQGPAIPPTIAVPGSQTLPGRVIGGLTNWYDQLTQDLEARGIPGWALGIGHGVMGALRGK